MGMWYHCAQWETGKSARSLLSPKGIWEKGVASMPLPLHPGVVQGCNVCCCYSHGETRKSQVWAQSHHIKEDRAKKCKELDLWLYHWATGFTLCLDLLLCETLNCPYCYTNWIGFSLTCSWKCPDNRWYRFITGLEHVVERIIYISHSRGWGGGEEVRRCGQVLRKRLRVPNLSHQTIWVFIFSSSSSFF